MSNVFGKRLAHLRKQKKLSQYKLAEILNTSRGKIGNYEQGSRQPDHDTLNQLADFFGVSTDYLLGRTDDPTPPDADEPTEQELEELMRKGGLMFDGEYLDEEDREDLLAVMKIAWQTIKKRKEK